MGPHGRPEQPGRSVRPDCRTPAGAPVHGPLGGRGTGVDVAGYYRGPAEGWPLGAIVTYSGRLRITRRAPGAWEVSRAGAALATHATHGAALADVIARIGAAE